MAKKTGSSCLTALELATLLRARAEADCANKELEASMLKRQLVRTQREAEQMALAEKYRLLEDSVGQRVRSAKAAFDERAAAHQDLARQMGAKYRVDFAACAYNELTGEISELPKE